MDRLDLIHDFLLFLFMQLGVRLCNLELGFIEGEQ